jgi:hypothetical protein
MAVEVTYDNSVTHITPTNVQAAIDLLIARGGTLGEAPTDGQVYGRQNAAWTSVGLPATNFPIMDSVAAVGASAKYAREDHVHPSDTTKASITYVDSGDTAVAGIAANKVAKAGDTMSGPLVLYADPANPGEAATKHYVDMSSGGAAPATAAPIMDSVATVGVATKYAREDHIHPSDTTKAPLASPALTGNPTVPTQAANDNSTKAASTAYVDAKEATANPVMNGAVAIGVSHLLARQDHVHASDTSRLGVAGGQTTTGGFRITPYSGGTVSSGTYTPDAFNHNYQYYTNNGAHTLAAPANDCAIDILITNGATAGAITFTGFTVGTTGDALTTVNASKFIVSVRRINAIATYTIKALQ